MFLNVSGSWHYDNESKKLKVYKILDIIVLPTPGGMTGMAGIFGGGYPGGCPWYGSLGCG